MQPLETTYVRPLPFNISQLQGRNSADPAYWLPRTGYRLPGDGPGVHGYGILPLLALIPLAVGLIGGGTAIGTAAHNKAQQKRALDQQLRDTVPCVAELDAKIAKLKKAKGVKKKARKLKDLKNKREQFALNPALCKPKDVAPVAAAPVATTFQPSTPETLAASDAAASGTATPSLGLWVVGGAAILGATVVVASLLRK